MVLADVLKRWQQLKGREAFLSTGTDEHGMKIQKAAAKQEMSPHDMCDANSAKFRTLTGEGGISHDVFIRTTQADHRKAVQEFWSQLKHSLPKSLGLYKGDHAGWYSVDDECFYPEKLVGPAIVPQTGKKVMASTETGSEVEWVKEETWFFPLTRYRESLLEFYDRNPGWIQPEHRFREVRDWVENHLEDLSVTRPYSRLTWGIRDPDDDKQTIYVWVDALINYLTIAGYGTDKWQAGAGAGNLWPADLHVVGKDIVRFHAVYWPALLLALGLPLPKKILCHNHWTMSSRKMSKSVGNVVSPTFAVQRWGTDPLRYFLMRNGSLAKDMDYSNDTIYAIYVKELQASLGNLYYRVARPKAAKNWSTRDALDSFVAGDFKACKENPDDPGTHYSRLEANIDAVASKFQKHMDEHDISGAIGQVYDLLGETNRYLSDTAPWALVKQDGNRQLVNWVIFNCAEALRLAAILLQPIMPTKAAQLLDELRVRDDRRTLAWAARGADDDYGLTSDDMEKLGRVQSWQTIFPPVPGGKLTDEEVREEFAISTPKVLLVPYESHHVQKYHGWMRDPLLQEATASEPMTLEEEYSNQVSWRKAHDKLTFIVCKPINTTSTLLGGDGGDVDFVRMKTLDSDERMVGDVNFFLYPYEDDENDVQQGKDNLTGEIDIMIAEGGDRRKGMGRAAVCALMVYIQIQMGGLLEEYVTAGGGRTSSAAALRNYMVKIKEGNSASRRLFEGLGFRQQGGANYFGEVKLVIDLADVQEQKWWRETMEHWRDIPYGSMADELKLRD
ncbi:methionyl-tRNA synthetase [Geosmithia morbida]|uniref:Probable methionine--tRNA ligase, mitochondrial n=1 Tax=Geosmithia morbida TaxID=1094350 RepID=A0A9P4YRZ2_9HYPO|nr:methionyl-tRNA synthetase [Geosmithia morbida]KAF4120699.1 methionyl-tRNA synthetase [Geosmithia morbida]